LLPRPSEAQIFSSTPYSQTPLAYVPPSFWATKFTKYLQETWLSQICQRNDLFKHKHYGATLGVTQNSTGDLTNSCK
jgi:hypothetical protein